jgi:hypothetical protein
MSWTNEHQGQQTRYIQENGAKILVTRHGVGIGNWIWHLQTVTTSNLSALANSCTLQFTTAHTVTSQAAVSSLVVAWQRLPTMQNPQLPCSRAPVLAGKRLLHNYTWPQLPHILACNCDSQITGFSSYIASGRIQQKTPLPTVPILLRHVFLAVEKLLSAVR